MIGFPVVTGCYTAEQLYDASKVITYVGHGVLGGFAQGSSVYNPGSEAYYWSSTYYDANNAYNLNFNSSGGINPQNANNKYNGFAVRCVKDSGKKAISGERGEKVKKYKVKRWRGIR